VKADLRSSFNNNIYNPKFNLEPMPSEAVTSYTSNINSSHNISKLSNHASRITNLNVNNLSLNQSRIEQDIINNNNSFINLNQSLFKNDHNQIDQYNNNNNSNIDHVEYESNGILSPIENEGGEILIENMNNIIIMKDKNYIDEFKTGGLIDSNITFQDMNNEESRFNKIHNINDNLEKDIDSIYNSSLNVLSKGSSKGNNQSGNKSFQNNNQNL